METQPEQSVAGSPTTERSEGFVVNAAIGAVVTVVTSFITFSPVIGGGVAGYLQRADRATGAKVGALSGLFAALPVAVVLWLVFGFLSVGAFSFGELAGGLLFVTILAFTVVLVAGLSAGFGAVGGYLGTVLAEDRLNGAPRAGGVESAPTGSDPTSADEYDEQ
jgi:hypothetical protein